MQEQTEVKLRVLQRLRACRRRTHCSRTHKLNVRLTVWLRPKEVPRFHGVIALIAHSTIAAMAGPVMHGPVDEVAVSNSRQVGDHRSGHSRRNWPLLLK